MIDILATIIPTLPLLIHIPPATLLTTILYLFSIPIIIGGVRIESIVAAPTSSSPFQGHFWVVAAFIASPFDCVFGWLKARHDLLFWLWWFMEQLWVGTTFKVIREAAGGGSDDSEEPAEDRYSFFTVGTVSQWEGEEKKRVG